jgi:hypothetical protein
VQIVGYINTKIACTAKNEIQKSCAFTARYELNLYMRFSAILVFHGRSCSTAVPRSDASVRQNRLIHLMATHNVRNNSVTALHSHLAHNFFRVNLDLLSFLPTRTAEYTVIWTVQFHSQLHEDLEIGPIDVHLFWFRFTIVFVLHRNRGHSYVFAKGLSVCSETETQKMNSETSISKFTSTLDRRTK